MGEMQRRPQNIETGGRVVAIIVLKRIFPEQRERTELPLMQHFARLRIETIIDGGRGPFADGGQRTLQGRRVEQSRMDAGGQSVAPEHGGIFRNSRHGRELFGAVAAQRLQRP